MADGYLNFDTRINTKGFEQGAKGISQKLNGVKSSLGKVAAAVGVAFSVAQISAFAKESEKLYNVQMEQELKLSTIMKTRMKATDETVQSVKDYASALQEQGVVGDEVQLAAAQQAATFLTQAENLKTLMPAMNNLLVQQHGLNSTASDAVSIGNMFGKVMQGQTSALRRVGITFSAAEENMLKYGDESQRAAALAQVITNNVGEMNSALAQTSAGKQQQLANTYGDIREQLGKSVSQLKQMLLPAVNAAVNAFSRMVDCIGQVVQAISKLAGYKLETSSSAAAGAAGDMADNYEEAADSAEAVEEAQENQLAAFDEINKLSSDSADNTSDDTSAALSTSHALTPEVDTKKASSMLDEFVKSARKAFSSLKKYIDEKFTPIFDCIWDGLKAETFKLQQTLGGVFGDIKTLAEPLKSYFAGDFTAFLQTAFATLGNIAVGLFDSFNMVFADIWNVAAFPMLQNFVTVGLPLITQFATQMLLTISTLFDSIKELFDTFWQEFTVPILDEIAQIWNDLWQTISGAWAEWGQPIFDSLREAITGTKDAILNIWEQWLRPLFDEFMAIIDSVWTEHLQPLLAEFLDFVGQLVSGALEIYNSAILPVINWLVQKLQPVVKSVGSYFLGVFHEILNAVIERARGIIRVLSGIVQFVTGAFTGDWQKAWNGIKQIFKGVWDTFYAVVKLPINLIIGAINAMTGAISDALNYIVDAVNELSFEVPDWVPGIGGEEFGFDLPNVYIPQIPKLAAGTVVPANYGEFMAVLGDNTREPEVVSPLSTMKQAVLEALVAYGGDGSGQKQPLYVTVQLDRRRVGQAMIDDINERTRRNGRSPLKA
jgi:hypothetical protein